MNVAIEAIPIQGNGHEVMAATLYGDLAQVLAQGDGLQVNPNGIITYPLPVEGNSNYKRFVLLNTNEHHLGVLNVHNVAVLEPDIKWTVSTLEEPTFEDAKALAGAFLQALEDHQNTAKPINNRHVRMLQSATNKIVRAQLDATDHGKTAVNDQWHSATDNLLESMRLFDPFKALL